MPINNLLIIIIDIPFILSLVKRKNNIDYIIKYKKENMRNCIAL